ncbi:MAG: CBS domain-containing protein [Spartobacteria bacterium]|nr:CBS domain-containing protein [Spartobacteria bacterium]
MKISASIFNSQRDPFSLAKGLLEAGANALHLDYIQDETPDEPRQWAELSVATGLPLDVHWIASRMNASFVTELNDINAQYLTIHVPVVSEAVLADLSKFKGQKGLGICARTGCDAVLPYLDAVDYVLVMSGEPGRPGGVFDQRCIDCIIEIRRKRPEIGIHVDGGITPQVMSVLRMFHVTMVVCGSYLNTQESIKESLCMLRFGHLAHTMSVSDFMVGFELAPTVRADDSLERILVVMTNGKRGAAVVVDEHREFLGLITDGDIRRGLMCHGAAGCQMTARSFMNSAPFCVGVDMDVLSFSKAISDIGSAVIVVPVLAGDGTTLLGIVDLHSNIFF